MTKKANKAKNTEYGILIAIQLSINVENYLSIFIKLNSTFVTVKLQMMKKLVLISTLSILLSQTVTAYTLNNDYGFLENITFNMYNENVPPYQVPAHIQSLEETLMFDILHATWKDKKWVAYTLNPQLLGTYKVGQPALLDNGSSKKMYFVAGLPNSIGGLDLYVSEFKNNRWSKPENLGSKINTVYNESNPGLLNDHILTYSSNGIIKKLDLNNATLIEEAAPIPAALEVKPVVTESLPVKKVEPADVEVIKETVTPKKEVIVAEKSEPVIEKDVTKPVVLQTPVSIPVESGKYMGKVELLGNSNTGEMLSKFGSAIQLGSFMNPNWAAFNQVATMGKLVSFKNEKNLNVVWLTGFANRTEADNILAKVKSFADFKNAISLGK